VLGVGPVIVVGVISKAVVIEVVLPGGRGAPCGSREGESSLIMGGCRMIGGGGGVDIWVVTDGLRVGSRGRWLVWIVDYTSTIEELRLSSITSGIVGVGVGRGVEGVRGEGEIRLGRDGR
jgi:hypothetical protein